MPESVAACPLRNPCTPDGFLHSTLQNRLVEVVTASLAGLGLHVDPRRREDPLPRPFPSRIGILASQRRGKLDPTCTSLEILLVQLPDALNSAARGRP